MRFTRISFKNYRCFLEGEIDFSIPNGSSPEKNIILFSAENGGGKTQLMFAFRFALYGMREKEFAEIQGQSATPYALNQNLYEALEKGPIGGKAEATVELAFVYEGNTYTIKRTHAFRRAVTGVAQPTERVLLNVQGPMGDTLSSVSSPEYVRAQISRIIPEKTLYALLCDGERVRKLSSTGTETNGAIQAIVQRMTEHDVLDEAYDGLNSVMKIIRRQVRQSTVNPDGCVDETAIETVEQNIKTFSKQVEEANNEVASARARMRAISEDLTQIAVVREMEQKRQDYLREVERFQEDTRIAEKQFIETLNEQCYWGIADRLSEDVVNLLSDSTLRFPGLQADVVETILKGDKCICGRDIDAAVRKIMDELRLHLPPINIDAELSSVLHQYGQEDFRRNRRREMAERLARMAELQEKITSTRALINSVSKEIEASHNPNAVQLETENHACIETISKYTRLGVEWERELRDAKERLEEMNRQIEEAAARNKRGGALQKRLVLVQGALKGIQHIKDFRLAEALYKINEHLRESFKALRSKSDAQRQVYVTMYQSLNELVVYHEDAARADYRMNVSQSMSPDEKRRVFEQAVLAHVESNSMGQQKMASLAFMKAILDYVRDVAANVRHMADAAYPIVVDAPFGDIKRENYDNAVACMHTFADQVILLLADEEVPPGIAPYVAKNYVVARRHDARHQSNYSVITLK